MKEEDIVEIFKRRTRNPLRPRSSHLIQTLFTHFKPFSPTGESLICGEAKYLDKRVLVIGQEKPTLEKLRNPENAKKLNLGMLSADEHSQILGILKQARSMDPNELVILCLIDTYGADISMTSARRFQAYFISHLIYEFLTIPIRTISVVIGEGGSGGALALQVTDRRAQLEDALYATAPPESMASIIFRDASRIREALADLQTDRPGSEKNRGHRSGPSRPGRYQRRERICPTPSNITFKNPSGIFSGPRSKNSWNTGKKGPWPMDCPATMESFMN